MQNAAGGDTPTPHIPGLVLQLLEHEQGQPASNAQVGLLVAGHIEAALLPAHALRTHLEQQATRPRLGIELQPHIQRTKRTLTVKANAHLGGAV